MRRRSRCRSLVTKLSSDCCSGLALMQLLLWMAPKSDNLRAATSFGTMRNRRDPNLLHTKASLYRSGLYLIAINVANKNGCFDLTGRMSYTAHKLAEPVQRDGRRFYRAHTAIFRCVATRRSPDRRLIIEPARRPCEVMHPTNKQSNPSAPKFSELP
jgi:hypothetical protein